MLWILFVTTARRSIETRRRGIEFLLVASLRINLALEHIPPFQRGNYFVIGFPPPTGSIVDILAGIFGPAPWYALGLAVFLAMWLPFGITGLIKRSRSGMIFYS